MALAAAVILAAAMIAVLGPPGAAVASGSAPNLIGSYSEHDVCTSCGGSAYDWSWQITNEDFSAGSFSGTSSYAGESGTLTGTVTGTSITMTDTRVDGYTWYPTGTLASGCSMSGKWTDNLGQSGTWQATSESGHCGSSGAVAKCRIDVHWAAVPVLGYTFAHLFVVYTDMTGAQYHYEAGPSNGDWLTGTIKSSQGPGASPSNAGNPITVASGSKACGKDSSGNPVPGFGQTVTQGPHGCFESQMKTVDRLKIKYWPSGPNSNSFVYTILLSCNITPKEPSGIKTPGWGERLFT